jgi:hypothetical protein
LQARWQKATAIITGLAVLVAGIYAYFAHQQVTAMRDAVTESQNLVVKTSELVIEQAKATRAAQQAADAATSAAKTARDEFVLTEGTDMEPEGLQCTVAANKDAEMKIALKSRNMGRRRATNVRIDLWYSVNGEECGKGILNNLIAHVVEGGAELPLLTLSDFGDA